MRREVRRPFWKANLYSRPGAIRLLHLDNYCPLLVLGFKPLSCLAGSWDGEIGAVHQGKKDIAAIMRLQASLIFGGHG